MHNVAARFAALFAAASCSLAAAGAPAASAHDAPMPNWARHGALINERWVMLHWAPFDERQAERELHLEPGQLQAFLYNDHRTLAQLALERDIAFEPLVARLARWTDDVPGADKAEIEQRIRLVLVSGHLAQHVFYHVFHGLAFTTPLVRAAQMPEFTFAQHRERGWSYGRIVRQRGGDPAAVQERLAELVSRNQQRGIDRHETPATEAHRMSALQHSRLNCWLTRPMQSLDEAAPYDRHYTKHAADHTAADVPTTRAEQAVEDGLISRGLAGRPPGCWDVPDQFHGDPGRPLTRHELRVRGRVPDGYKGKINDTMDSMGAMEMAGHTM